MIIATLRQKRLILKLFLCGAFWRLLYLFLSMESLDKESVMLKEK
jgi:hypothetical protein